MNDFGRQWAEIRSEALTIFEEVGASGWYILGRQVKEFESSLAQFWGLGQAAGVASGLDALEIALRAAGLQTGDKVLTTPLSAFATTLAIVRAGGVPVFCDTGSNGLLDLDEAEAALKAIPGIRFFVPVHLYGFPLDPHRLRRLIVDYGLICIEDCAQSIGAFTGTEPTGRAGVAAATSFYPTKNLGAMGDGGAVLTDSEEFAASVRRLRDYGQSAKYRHSDLGWNSRLDELHAALLDKVFLPRLADWTERRRRIAEHYRTNWNAVHAAPLAPPRYAEPCWHLFPLAVPSGKPGLQEHLRRCGVLTGEHYPLLIPDQEAMAQVPYVRFGGLERAAQLAERQLSLPIHPFLSIEEAQRVLDAVTAWEPQVSLAP
jgi:dTDP-3-amino-3,4,6-trideoxy-alpha-D-glucose transaminase